MFSIRIIYLGFLLTCCFLCPLFAQDSIKADLQLLLTHMCQAQTVLPMQEVSAQFWILDQHTSYLESLSDATLLSLFADDLRAATEPPRFSSTATCQLKDLKITIDEGFAVTSFRERVERPEIIVERVAMATLELTSFGWKIHTLAYHTIH
jgi:hypothetical protein